MNARRAAIRAVHMVDVDLTTAPPEPVELAPEVMPLKETDMLKAKRKLREATDGAQVKSTNNLPTMPGINALSFTIRYLPGGRERFLEMVKLAANNGDPHADAWWAVFADLTPYTRKRISFDDVCIASGVKPSQLLPAIVGHAMEASIDAGNLIAAMFHPQVVAAMGKSAIRTSGEHAEVAAEDRRAFLQGRGFLPTPKGASVHVHANASANAAAAANSSTEPSVPKFADDMQALGNVRRGAGLLPEAAIDGTVEP